MSKSTDRVQTKIHNLEQACLTQSHWWQLRRSSEQLCLVAQAGGTVAAGWMLKEHLAGLGEGGQENHPSGSSKECSGLQGTYRSKDYIQEMVCDMEDKGLVWWLRLEGMVAAGWTLKEHLAGLGEGGQKGLLEPGLAGMTAVIEQTARLQVRSSPFKSLSKHPKNAYSKKSRLRGDGGSGGD